MNRFGNQFFACARGPVYDYTIVTIACFGDQVVNFLHWRGYTDNVTKLIPVLDFGF